MFGWIRRKENKWWGLGVFISPSPPKCFLPKIEKKLIGNEFFLDWQKYQCFLQVALSLSLSLCYNTAFFFLFFFLATTLPVTLPLFFASFFLFLGNHVASCHFFFSWALTLPLFLFSFCLIFFFSFDFLGLGHDSFFLFYTRCDFFFGIWFLFF